MAANSSTRITAEALARVASKAKAWEGSTDKLTLCATPGADSPDWCGRRVPKHPMPRKCANAEALLSYYALRRPHADAVQGTPIRLEGRMDVALAVEFDVPCASARTLALAVKSGVIRFCPVSKSFWAREEWALCDVHWPADALDQPVEAGVLPTIKLAQPGNACNVEPARLETLVSVLATGLAKVSSAESVKESVTPIRAGLVRENLGSDCNYHSVEVDASSQYHAVALERAEAQGSKTLKSLLSQHRAEGRGRRMQAPRTQPLSAVAISRRPTSPAGCAAATNPINPPEAPVLTSTVACMTPSAPAGLVQHRLYESMAPTVFAAHATVGEG